MFAIKCWMYKGDRIKHIAIMSCDLCGRSGAKKSQIVVGDFPKHRPLNSRNFNGNVKLGVEKATYILILSGWRSIKVKRRKLPCLLCEECISTIQEKA